MNIEKTVVAACVMIVASASGAGLKPKQQGKQVQPEPLELRDLIRTAKRMRATLVWESNRTGGWEIFATDVGSREVRRLTNNELDDHHPVWAPDGSAIYFDRGGADGGPSRIMRMKPDGSGTEVVVENAFHPSLTADGETLVFVRREDGHSRVISRKLEAGTEREILPEALPYLVNSRIDQPSISPDGSRLAFYTSYRGNYVRAVDVSGGNAAIIGRGSQPDFAPEGARVAWSLGSVHKIYSSLSDGSRAEELAGLARPRAYLHFPRWSNSPNKIVFAAGPHFDTQRADYEIFLKHIGDVEKRAVRLTFNTGTDRWPDLFIAERLEPESAPDGLEKRQGWHGLEWANQTTVTAETIGDDNSVISAEYKEEGKGKAGIWLDAVLNLSEATHLTFDAFNESKSPIEIAIALKTGDGMVYHETKTIPVKPGKWMRDLVIDLTGADFKAEAVGWKFEARLQDPGEVRGIGFFFYKAPEEGRVRLDAVAAIPRRTPEPIETEGPIE